MKNSIPKILILGCVFGFCGVIHSQEESSQSLKQITSIATAEDAIGRALQYTGFDKAEGFSKANNVKAELTTLENDNTPFVWDKIPDKEVWLIQFTNIPVGQRSVKIAYRDFDVLLDKLTGKLLKIYSISETAGSSDTLPQPSREATEEYFRSCNFPINELPDSISSVSFWEALKTVRVATPSSSKIIKAYYWDMTRDKNKHEYSWLIIQRGIENPLPTSHGNTIAKRYRNFMMSCIDAISGQPVFATTAPYDPKDTKK